MEMITRKQEALDRSFQAQLVELTAQVSMCKDESRALRAETQAVHQHNTDELVTKSDLNRFKADIAVLEKNNEDEIRNLKMHLEGQMSSKELRLTEETRSALAEVGDCESRMTDRINAMKQGLEMRVEELREVTAVQL